MGAGSDTVAKRGAASRLSTVASCEAKMVARSARREAAKSAPSLELMLAQGAPEENDRSQNWSSTSCRKQPRITGAPVHISSSTSPATAQYIIRNKVVHFNTAENSTFIRNAHLYSKETEN